jgi:hypothetical protein
MIQQLRQPDGWPGGRVKGPLSQGIYSTAELETSSRQPKGLYQTRAKEQPMRKILHCYKERATHSFWGMVKKGVADDNDDDYE